MENKLMKLQSDYKKKKLSKKEYIQEMHQVHQVLWDYSESIKGKNIREITINLAGVTVTTQTGIRMICDPLDERIIPIEIINFGDYETEEIEMIRRFLKKDSIILDIGANIGWYSMNLAKNVPQGRIIAFEPIPKTFNYLKQNLRDNGIKNVRIFNYGLSEKKGTFDFYYDPKQSGATSLRNLCADQVKVKCVVKQLDEVIPKMTSKIDFIKCDVEGAELFVLKGGIQTLRKTMPIIFLEMLRKWSAKFGYHPNAIIDYLGGIGYQCYFTNKKRLKAIKQVTESTQATNFYFLHPSKHSALIRKCS